MQFLLPKAITADNSRKGKPVGVIPMAIRFKVSWKKTKS